MKGKVTISVFVSKLAAVISSVPGSTGKVNSVDSRT